MEYMGLLVISVFGSQSIAHLILRPRNGNWASHEAAVAVKLAGRSLPPGSRLHGLQVALEAPVLSEVLTRHGD
jgi:hypothetical protein